MEILPLTLYLRVASTVCLIFLLSFAASLHSNPDCHENPCTTYTYNRFPQIQEKCVTVISSASELRPDDDRGSRIKEELFFENGDWDQDSVGAVPLMPFDDKNMRQGFTDSCSAVKLVSFWVSDVNTVHHSNKMVSISGIMRIGITRRYGMFSYKPDDWSGNGGERLLCMLGTALMPHQFSDESGTMNAFGYTNIQQPGHVKEDQILLVLRYPRTFTLTTSVRGEMHSLNGKSNATYFDKLRISSRLSRCNKYNLGVEELLLKACNPYPYKDILVDEKIIMFKEDQFCNDLQRLLSGDMFKFSLKRESSRECHDGDKLGPFVLGWRINGCTGDISNFRLLVQDFRCEVGTDENQTKAANVSAVFRLINFEQDRYVARERTSLSGMTLSAEGMWKSSHGQLCMVGCIGLTGATSERCNSRICLYLSLTFSLHQRSIIFGTISNIDPAEMYPSLYIEAPTHYKHLLNKYERRKRGLPSPDRKPRIMKFWSYRYSRTKEAIAFQNRTRLSIFCIYMKSLLSYPSFDDHNLVSLSRLADELSFRIYAVPYASSKLQRSKAYVEVDVLSLGPLFGRYLSQSKESHQHLETFFDSYANNGIEISGHLGTKGRSVSNLSLAFEGIYNPTVGEMYLLGCRDIRDLQRALRNVTKLEKGKDCEIEIIVEYPPTTLKDFGRIPILSPKAKIFISSKRGVEDSLYFSPVTFFTDPIFHKSQLNDLIMWKLNVGGPLLQPAIDPHTNKNTQKLLQWLAELDEYSGIVQDFFLLPQIIDNTLWQIQGKPLKKLYYIGVTILRILLHIYDYIIEPIPEPYYDAEQYQNMNFESNSKFANIMVAFIVIVLAFIVYLQQKSHHKELGYTDRRTEDYKFPVLKSVKVSFLNGYKTVLLSNCFF